MRKFNIYNETTYNLKKEERVIKSMLKHMIRHEKLKNIYFNVIIVDNPYIHKINKEYRNIDKETDVLSFPMFQKEEIEGLIKKKENIVTDILGDVVISIPRVYEQAEEYNHSFERELSYMVVHGFYHLMGYDHMEEEEKKIMRQKEENVLQKLNITR